MNNTEKENIKVPTAKNIYRESQNIKIKSTFLTYSNHGFKPALNETFALFGAGIWMKFCDFS